MKPILKKYISESHHIYTIDRPLGFLNIGRFDIFIRFNFDLHDIYYCYCRQEELIVDVLKELAFVYVKHGIRSRERYLSRERYFNFDEIKG